MYFSDLVLRIDIQIEGGFYFCVVDIFHYLWGRYQKIYDKEVLNMDIKISRKKFIEKQGATCKNWNWSWSFVNHDERFVIFGTWDEEPFMTKSIILKDIWIMQTNRKTGVSRKAPGFYQALEHIDLIINKGYELRIFRMVYNQRGPDSEVAKIKNFDQKLHTRNLLNENGVWYATIESMSTVFPDEITDSEIFIEGAKKRVTVNSYERDPEARLACIAHYGTTCQCCGFDFEEVYGEHGKGFIHVHHVKALSTLGEGYKLNPVKDLIPLCPNCHAMVHRGNKLLQVSELIDYLKIAH